MGGCCILLLSQFSWNPSAKRYRRLIECHGGPVHFPLLLAALVQIGKLLPAARTRGPVSHIGQPIENAVFVKGVLARLVAAPNDLFADFVGAEADGTAVGDLPLAGERQVAGLALLHDIILRNR